MLDMVVHVFFFNYEMPAPVKLKISYIHDFLKIVHLFQDIQYKITSARENNMISNVFR
jgi:hypothetical protein